MNLPIYLDNHATTRVDDRVLAEMLPYFAERFGNASSRQHQFGWEAEAAVERARLQTAALIGARPEEIVFTAGATESINLALKGLAEASAPGRTELVTSVTEHHAVLDSCLRLEQAGFKVVRLPVDSHGLVDPDDVRRALTPATFAVSIMAANNEIGTLAPLAEIGAVCREQGVPFHTDATQAVPHVPVDVDTMKIDLLSASAHKMYGPKGVGFLYIRSGFRPVPQTDGGGQERGLRSGTLNVPGIVGLGAAADLVRMEGPDDARREEDLRDTLLRLLTDRLDGLTLNGHPSRRIPNNLSLTLAGIAVGRLLLDLREVALSAGSACSSASPSPSHVLTAIGRTPEEAGGTIRIGLGRFTTAEEIAAAAAYIAAAIETVRKSISIPDNA